MNYRELLRLAAKAVGFTIERYGDFSAVFVLNEHDTEKLWNPIGDDGDAMRLMIDLRMEVYYGCDEGERVYASYHVEGRICYCSLPIDGKPRTATRNVIVQAAAKTGEGMENES